MGYAGGTADDPTYRRMGDHTETVQIDYDPTRISYNQLLEIIWDSHQPTSQSWSRQYQNVIFFHNKAQEHLAIASKSARQTKMSKQIKTRILPLRSFTLAEDYHQKYLLKQHALNREIKRFYPKNEDLIDSTTAARFNGYAGGYGTKDQLSREIDNLGLSRKGKEILLNLVQK